MKKVAQLILVQPLTASGRCCTQSFGCVLLFTTPWTAATQSLLSKGFSRQEYLSRLPCPPPGDLPNTGIKPRTPALQAGSLPSEPPGEPKNSGLGSLSLLKEFQPRNSTGVSCICRQILSQLSYQGSPEQHLSSVQFSSVTQSCPTLCSPMNHSTPGLPVHQQFPESTQIHVH